MYKLFYSEMLNMNYCITAQLLGPTHGPYAVKFSPYLNNIVTNFI